MYGRPFEVHDGLLDVTHESDLVTVSYSVFRDHDKTNLVGSGDGRQALDGGRLRVTWHHNLWDDAGQRLPRVRFGDVDVYNNYVRVGQGGAALFDYAWGVGVESSIWAERNAFDLPVAAIVKRWGGTRLHAEHTLVNGVEVDVLSAYNAAAAEGDRLVAGARWDPVTAGVRGAVVHEVTEVRDVVLARAGSGVLAPAAEEPAEPDPGPTTPVTPPGEPGDGGSGGGAGGAGTDGAGADGVGAAGATGVQARSGGTRDGGLAVTGVGALGALAAVGALVAGGMALVRVRGRVRG